MKLVKRGAIFFLIILIIVAGVYRYFFDVTKEKNTYSSAEKLANIVESNTLCKAPCWQGLIPGVSTEEDFLALINSDYAKMHFQDIGKNENPSTFYHLYDNNLDLALEIRINNDRKITSINFYPSDFTHETIIEQLGIPDFYEAAGFSDLSYYITLKYIYQSYGIILAMQTWDVALINSCQLNASPELPIRAIYFTQIGVVNEMVDTVDPFFRPQIQEVRSWPETNILELKPC